MIETIATCITAAGVLIAVLQLRASRVQRRRQFEALYVQRYWAIMDLLSLQALRGEHCEDVQPQDEKAAWAYLRLCEDELELRASKWVSTPTWTIWSWGMREQLQRWPFSEVWKRHVESGDESFALLRRHMTEEDFDPRKARG